jgi:hypothetical protein
MTTLIRTIAIRGLTVLTLLLAPIVAVTQEQPKPDSWKGIPLMPGYQSEREVGSGVGYLTVISVPADEAEQWYRERMNSDGWSVTVHQRSPESLIGGGPLVSLDFKRTIEQVNVMLIYSVRERHTIAIHTRIAP